MRRCVLPGVLRISIPLVLASVSSGLTSQLFAADTLPIGGIDARATGKVSSAQTASDGAIYSGLSISGGSGVVSQKTLLGNESDEMLVNRANRASVVTGFGLAKHLELSLGLHGTYENVDADSRKILEGNTATSGDSTPKASAFSGASLMVKGRIFDGENLSLALAPFIESGAGASAEGSLTRSMKPKAGWMLLASYGSAGVAELNLNGGYRYRNTEVLGDLNFRNEAFWGASVKGYLSKSFAVFVSGSGRRLMVANENERDPSNGKLNYLAATTVDASAGLALTAGASEFSAYFGQTVKGLLGSGNKFAGAAGAWNIDSGSKSRGKRSFADDVKTSEPSAQVASGSTKSSSKGNSEYPEMDATEIDPLTDFSGDGQDDFSIIEAKMKEDAKNPKASNIEIVERELGQIREAEAKAESARFKAEQIALEKQRAERVKAAKGRAGTENKWKKDADAEAAKLDGITDDEMTWMGLE